MSVIFNGFRESGKTVLVKYYIIRCIVYKKHHYICFICDESNKAQKRLGDISKQLQENKRLIKDFGRQLVQKEKKQNAHRIQRLGDFETIQDIKVEAIGVGESFRGRVHNVVGGGEHRPSLVVFDDVDTTKSCANSKMIDKMHMYVTTEVMGGMDKSIGQMIFLYNTIYEDGVGPRLFSFLEDKKNRKRMRVPLVDESYDNITWQSRYDIDKIYEIRDTEGDIAFSQNYLLIPYMGGQSIVQTEWIRKVDYVPDSFDLIQIGVDPSISEKTKSDPFAIVIAGLIGDNRYIIDHAELEGSEKNKAYDIIEDRYISYKADIVNVETVAFQKVIANNLRAKGIAVKDINTHKDKVSRLLEREHAFKSGQYLFCKGNEKVVSQLLLFPNAKHDDLVDAFMFATHLDKKKKGKFR